MDTTPPERTDAPPGMTLARQGALHAALALALLVLFAAADSWQMLSAIALANLFSVVVGLLAGALLTTLLHEWSHLLGARLTGARYSPARRPSLLVFDWDFGANTRRQFLVMSVAGTLGSVAAVYLLCSTVPGNAPGRIALQGAAWGSLVFAAVIEWPVLYRVRRGEEPLAALGRITPATVGLGAGAGLVAIGLSAWLH
jgi:hypothetical protein